MKTVYEFFEEICRDNQIKYYDSEYRTNDIRNIFIYPRYFIEDTLACGQKMNLHTEELLDNMLNMRLEHTVSIYLLGLTIYYKNQIMYDNINKFINEMRINISDDINFNFLYFWFMICFYHDFGYKFEELYCCNKSLGEILKLQEGNLSLNVGGSPKGIPTKIRENLNKYINYRYCHANKLDHGIVGGALFWSDRKKQYYDKRDEYGINSFSHFNVRYSEDILLNVHRYVAWVISAHNIWFCYDKDKEKEGIYRKYGLEKLIIENPVILYNKHCLLYLLSLVDTIDPVKYLRNNDCLNSLQSFDIEFEHDRILINTNIQDKEEYFVKLKDMSNWLFCKVFCEGDKLVIKFTKN